MAMIRTRQGPINVGVHSWHVLLNMVSPFDPPHAVEYGVTSDQRANIAASLAGMTAEEQVQLLGSLLRTMALLLHEVAEVVEEAAEDSPEDGG